MVCDHKKIPYLIQPSIMSQPKNLACLSKCVNSEVQNTNDCVVPRDCTPPRRQKLLRTSQKKEIKEGVAIGAFRSILFLFLFLCFVFCVWFCFCFFFCFLFLFFSFCYRHCGSAKVKLVLNFSMELNRVYTIQNKYR